MVIACSMIAILAMASVVIDLGLVRSARRDDQAIEQLRKTIEIDPGFIESHLYLGWVYEGKGMFTEAIAELRQDERRPRSG